MPARRVGKGREMLLRRRSLHGREIFQSLPVGGPRVWPVDELADDGARARGCVRLRI